MADTSQSDKGSDIQVEEPRVARSALKQNNNSNSSNPAIKVQKNSPKKNGTRFYIGRRTGNVIAVDKSLNLADCFPIPDDDEDEENNSLKENAIQQPAKQLEITKSNPTQTAVTGQRHFIGRRTGKVITINKEISSDLKIEDLFPKQEDSVLLSSSCNDDTANKTNFEEHLEAELMETVQTETDQTEDKQASDDQNETVPDTKAQLNEHEPSSEGKGTATPIENPAVDSPNLTGTAVKNAANMDKSDVKFYGSKKRLFPPCEDSVCNSPINVVDVSRDEAEHQSEVDIDITGVNSDEEEIDVENYSMTTTEKCTKSTKDDDKSKSKTSQQLKFKKKSNKSSLPDEDADDTFANIESHSTFLTIGNKSKTVSNYSKDIDITGVSFTLDESAVQEGAKHKEMSPETGGTKNTKGDKSKQAKKASKGREQSNRKPEEEKIEKRATGRRKTNNSNKSKNEEQFENTQNVDRTIVEEESDKSITEKNDNMERKTTKSQKCAKTLTNDEDTNSSKRTTRHSAKERTSILKDPVTNDKDEAELKASTEKPLRKSSRGKINDTRTDFEDKASQNDSPRRITRKSILISQPSVNTTLQDKSQSSSESGEDTTIHSKKSKKKSICFSLAVNTDDSVDQPQDVSHSTVEPLDERSVNASKSRNLAEGKNSKTSNRQSSTKYRKTNQSMNETLDQETDEKEQEESSKLERSTRSRRTTRSAILANNSIMNATANSTLNNTKGRKSTRGRNSTKADESLVAEREGDEIDKDTSTVRENRDDIDDNNDVDDNDVKGSNHVDDGSNEKDSNDVGGDDDEVVENDDDDNTNPENSISIVKEDDDDMPLNDGADAVSALATSNYDDDISDDEIVVAEDDDDDEDQLSSSKDCTSKNNNLNASRKTRSKQNKSKKISTLSDEEDSREGKTRSQQENKKKSVSYGNKMKTSEKVDKKRTRKSKHNTSQDEETETLNKQETKVKRKSKQTASLQENEEESPRSNDKQLKGKQHTMCSEYQDDANIDETGIRKKSRCQSKTSGKKEDGYTNQSPEKKKLRAQSSEDEEGEISKVSDTTVQGKSHLQMLSSEDEAHASNITDNKEPKAKKSRKRSKNTTHSIREATQNNDEIMPVDDHTQDNVKHSFHQSVSNEYEADTSQNHTLSDSSIRKSPSVPKSKTKRRKMSRVVPRGLQRVIRSPSLKITRKTSENSSTTQSSEGETHTASDEDTQITNKQPRKRKEKNVQVKHNSKTSKNTTICNNSRSKKSDSDDDIDDELHDNNNGHDDSEDYDADDNDYLPLPVHAKDDTLSNKNKSQRKPSKAVNNKSRRRSNSEEADNITPIAIKSPCAKPKSSTIIKSILKSSVPGSLNSNKKKRRVSISAKKRQTQSSDEDDEDASPNASKKRRSSVSFAPTPSFRITPDDFTTPEDTPGGYPKLSFVTNSSSFSLGDSTFAPSSFAGSPSSTISSISSTSQISNDSGLFNVSQEVTIGSAKRRQVEEDEEQGIRRSKRTKVPPLQYWKNERIKYERRKSGWCIDGIEYVPTPKPTKRKKKPSKNQAKAPKAASYEGYGGAEPQSFDHDPPEDMEETVCDPVTVINPYDGQEVELDLLHTPEMLQFVNAAQEAAKQDDPLIMDKYISHNLFGIGQLILRPGAEKGKQHVRKDTMTFHVLTGQVEVTIHETTALLKAGSTFIVPEGNCYNLKNTYSTETRLFFVQIKAKQN